MAKNEKFNEEDGVWRTIGGRRVFIRNGQSLSEAMIESGKFKNLRSEYRKAKEEEKTKEEKQEWDKSDEDMLKSIYAYSNEEKNVEEDSYYKDLVDKYGEKEVKNKFKDLQEKYDIETNTYTDSEGVTYNTLKEKTETGNVWEKQPDGTFLANKDAMKKQYEENHKNYDAKIKQFAEDRKNMTNGDWEGMLMAYEQQNADGTYKSLQDIMDDVDKYEKENDKGAGKFELTDNNFKNNWQDEIKTKEQLLEKEKEVKEQYENYKELVAKNNWNSTTVAKNEESYKKTLQNIEDWKKEFDAQEQGFTSKSTNPFYPDKEYSKEDLDKMTENGVQPMKNTYSGNGWKGINADKNLSTKEQAKAVTDAMKQKYSDVKISRKSDVYSGGSSIDFNIMSSDKDLYISDADIDKLGSEQLFNTDITRGYGFERWANENVDNYRTDHTYSVDDVKKYAKETLANLKSHENQNVSGDEWYLSDYGKKVVSDLNKEANSYTYDDSDAMTDYFNHGTYMNVSIGKWDKPYQVNQKSINETMNNAIREKASAKRFPTTLSREIYNMDVDKGNAWSGNAVQKTANGEQFVSVRKNGPSQNSASDIANNIMKKYPQLDAKVIGDNEVKVTLKGNNSINDAIRQKAYKKYLKEHPGSKITFEQFKK